MTDVPSVDAADEFLCHLGAMPEACTDTERAAFLGCPDATRPCSKIIMTFSGGSDTDKIGFAVSHSVQGCIDGEIEGGCVHDPYLGNAHGASSWIQASQPEVLIGDVTRTTSLIDNGDGTRTLTVYWQGQRGQRRVWSDANRVWSRYPDLDPVGGTDYFVFRAYSGSRMFQSCTTLPTTCWAAYTGDAGTQAYVVLDNIRPLQQSSRGKKPKTNPATIGIEFDVQAFTGNPRSLLDGSIDYKDPAVVESNLESWAEMMLVHEGGKQMIAGSSSGIDPDDPEKPEIYRSSYRFTFPEPGCYEFRLLEVFIQDVDALEYAWYSQDDLDAVKTLRVNHDINGGETTWSPGETCP